MRKKILLAVVISILLAGGIIGYTFKSLPKSGNLEKVAFNENFNPSNYILHLDNYTLNIEESKTRIRNHEDVRHIFDKLNELNLEPVMKNINSSILICSLNFVNTTDVGEGSIDSVLVDIKQEEHSKKKYITILSIYNGDGENYYYNTESIDCNFDNASFSENIESIFNEYLK
jgi:hypothetical protein